MNKRTALTIIIVLLAGAYCAHEASAAQAWYTCKVVMAGPAWGQVFICLSDTASVPAFTNTWFTAPPVSDNQLLAMTLTAINNDCLLYVNIDLTQGQFPPINVMYIIP